VNVERSLELWEKMGAHIFCDSAGAPMGTQFRVWAPAARAVELIGDFNNWKPSSHLMVMNSDGIWELFVAGIGVGTRYKFRIQGKTGTWVDHADPYANQTEVPPENSSIVTMSTHVFGDQQWLQKRSQSQASREPISIYEIHLGSWKSGLSYRELATELVSYVKKLGFTHVEFMPICGHPYAPSWGYQVTSFFAPTPRFGTPDDLKFLIDALHQADIGVILDWVPAHFPKDEWALAKFDGTPLYEHKDPHKGEHPDWGTLIFDYEKSSIREFLIASALYWLKEFHFDGIRVDAVASMLYLDYSRGPGEWKPNKHGGSENLEAVQFLQELTTACHEQVPGSIMFAEESTAWPGVTHQRSTGGLGFGFKWNMGWMHDTLQYFREEPIYRNYHYELITKPALWAFSENFLLPFSHDEVVHGKGSMIAKMSGTQAQKFSTLRALYAYMWAHPGKKLLFMGNEFGQLNEWNSEQSLSWQLLADFDHQTLERLIADLNREYRSFPELWAMDDSSSSFTPWSAPNISAKNIVALMRSADQSTVLLSLSNFGPEVEKNYPLPPTYAEWQIILDTDDPRYGGSQATKLTDEGNDSPTLTIAPLSTIWLRGKLVS